MSDFPPTYLIPSHLELLFFITNQYSINNNCVGKCFKKIRKEKEKARSAATSSNKISDRPERKFFRCGYEDHMITKSPKPPKDSEKKRKSDKSK